MKMEIQNKSSSALSFRKEEFMLADFSVDNFVSSCRKYVSLETMLEDLALYHKILCSLVVELINKDYADFLNLSSNLVGLDKAIKNLSFPLEKLRTEVGHERNNLNNILKDIEAKFSHMEHACMERVEANYFLCLVENFKSIELLYEPTKERVERIALDLAYMNFYVTKISFFKNKDDTYFKEKVQLELIGGNLKEQLSNMFLQSLSKNDVSSLVKILHIYTFNAVTEKEAENYFSTIFAKPYMKKHLTEQNILTYGLPAIYGKILDFIPNFCSAILDATQGHLSNRCLGFGPEKGDDFMMVVFTEVVYSLELITPIYIYAPGDPELFHHNFSATVSFLREFERYCTNVKKLRNHVLYKTFLSKYNIDLYFEIRFEEIAGSFESCLLAETFTEGEAVDNMKESERDKDLYNKRYRLNVSTSLLRCIRRCWDNKTFLYPLVSRFYQLSLQLISRFSTWLSKSIKNNSESFSPLQVAMIITDVEMIITDLNSIFDVEIASKGFFPRQLAEGAFEESLKMLQAVLPLATSILIQLLLTECNSHLKMINDIPRMYRKTNRKVPTKASAYVALVFDSLEEFLLTAKSFLSPEIRYMCVREVTEGILLESFALIEDVQTGIRKMEESLRILKRARAERGTNTHTHKIDINTDDDKIRRQLAIDVQTIEDKIKKNLGLEEVENLKKLKELKQLISLSEKQLT